MSKDINDSTFILINHLCGGGGTLNITMVDVFGGSGISKNTRGPRGPMGPRGQDGSISDYCQWLPATILKNLQENEEHGCFLIKDPTKDLTMNKKEVKTWVSRTAEKFNLVGEKPSTDLIKLKDRYVLGFKKNQYVSKDMTFMDTEEGSSGFLCVTFKVFGEGEQALLSNYSNSTIEDYCEIRVTSNEIILHIHSEDEIIQHSCKDWTTLFVGYNSDETQHTSNMM